MGNDSYQFWHPVADDWPESVQSLVLTFNDGVLEDRFDRWFERRTAAAELWGSFLLVLGSFLWLFCQSKFLGVCHFFRNFTHAAQSVAALKLFLRGLLMRGPLHDLALTLHSHVTGEVSETSVWVLGINIVSAVLVASGRGSRPSKSLRSLFQPPSLLHSNSQCLLWRPFAMPMKCAGAHQCFTGVRLANFIKASDLEREQFLIGEYATGSCSTKCRESTHLLALLSPSAVRLDAQ